MGHAETFGAFSSNLHDAEWPPNLNGAVDCYDPENVDADWYASPGEP
jgi:hypothetical protein